MGLATEIWTARSYVAGLSAHQSYLVSGVADENEAKAICPVAANSTFRIDNRLRASEPRVTSPDNPLTYVVEFDYAPPSSGSSSGNNAPSDLLRPPIYHPQISLSTEDVDADIEGNAIVNSAGSSFSSPQKKRFPSLRYVYRRFESSFDGARAIAFTGVVNSDSFNMPGFGSVTAGQAFCESIVVAAAFNRTSSSIEIQYSFELRADGFKTRILDEGGLAYYVASNNIKLGKIFTTNGETVSKALLNGLGAPINATLSVGAVGTAGSNISAPIGATVTGSNLAKFLQFKLYREMPFSGLTLTE